MGLPDFRGNKVNKSSTRVLHEAVRVSKYGRQAQAVKEYWLEIIGQRKKKETTMSRVYNWSWIKKLKKLKKESDCMSI